MGALSRAGRARRPSLHYYRVTAIQPRQRFAQPSCRKQSVLNVFRREQNNVEVACKRTVLKAVVQNMDFRFELGFCQQTGLIPALAHNHRTTEPLGNQNWLIAEFLCGTIWIDHEHAACLAAISAREYIKADTALLQQFPKQNHEGSLSRSANRNISYTNYRPGEPSRLQNAAVIEAIAGPHPGSVGCAEWVHAELTWSTR